VSGSSEDVVVAIEITQKHRERPLSTKFQFCGVEVDFTSPFSQLFGSIDSVFDSVLRPIEMYEKFTNAFD